MNYLNLIDFKIFSIYIIELTKEVYYMAHPQASRRKVHIICSLMFISAVIIMAFTGLWWPGSLLAIGIPLALRQYLLGRYYDTAVSLVVFIGGFISIKYDILWEIILPTAFILGAIYILFREFTYSPKESEDEEDKNEEIEEHLD